jgi:hypothetical protein
MDNSEIMSIILNVVSNDKEFLNKIYGITSYETGMEYLNNNESIIEQSTTNRILNCLYSIYIDEDFFPSTEFINRLYNSYYNVFNIKIKKNGLKNIIINEKHSSKKTKNFFFLIGMNLKYIIDE